MVDSNLPLIAEYQPQRTFAWQAGNAVSCASALAAIRTLAGQLQPNTPYINLCEQRYGFTVAFAAIGLAGGVNLLPQNHAVESLDGLRADYPTARVIDDLQVSAVLESAPAIDPNDHSPTLPASRHMADVFTSGSTGQPGRHSKYWGDLVLGAQLYGRRFFADGARPNTVATVPPQHMYGLETTVMPALQLGYAVDSGRPFMPWVISEALMRLPAPRLLVTTPVHLRACHDAGIALPELGCIISSTAPLDADLARAAETSWHTPVKEIYGCTETGSVASHRTASEDHWTLYDGMYLSQQDGVWMHGQQLPEPFAVSDQLEILDAQSFRLLGRSGDMLKIAGKRMSVNDLIGHLRAIDGVQDAVVFRPDGEHRSPRPAALVVAPDVDEQVIAAQLARTVDAVFVPRPLLRVDSLPRNALGKVLRDDLLALLRQARSQHASRP